MFWGVYLVSLAQIAFAYSRVTIRSDGVNFKSVRFLIRSIATIAVIYWVLLWATFWVGAQAYALALPWITWALFWVCVGCTLLIHLFAALPTPI